MRRSNPARWALSVLALSISAAFAQGVDTVTAENGNLWFVELSGAPTADGNSVNSVRNEKAAFRRAAAAAAPDLATAIAMTGADIAQASGWQ